MVQGWVLKLGGLADVSMTLSRTLFGGGWSVGFGA